MTTEKRQREIVIEFEKVRTIRKRATTTLANCGGCDAETDAVTLIEAAGLFEITHENLFHFIKHNDCHYHVSSDDKIYLCVPSLIESMHRKNGIRQLAAKGELR